MFDNLLRGWNQQVWQVEAVDLPPLKRSILLSLRGIQMILSDLLEGTNSLYAKGLVYMSILSLVPLLAVMFSVLKGFGVHNQLQPLLLQLLSPLGEKGVEITTTILTFVDNIKVGVLGAVGLGILIFTVISLIQQIEAAFNSTWRVRKLRPLLERFSHYISVLLVGPVLIFSAIGLSQSVQHLSLFQQALETETGLFLYNTLSVYLPFFMTVIAIAFVYMFVPNTRVRFSAAFFGAVITSLLFKAATAMFTQFIVGSTKYDAIYSAFATVILLFIWLYITWLILLLGSSIAYYYQHSDKLLFHYRDSELSPYENEVLSLQLLVQVTRHFYAKDAPISMDEAARQLQLPDDMVEKFVSQLERDNFLKVVDDEKLLLPGRPPDETTAAEVIACIHDSSMVRSKRVKLHVDESIIHILAVAETNALSSIKDITVKQLALENTVPLRS